MKSRHNIKEFFYSPTNIGVKVLFSGLTFTGKEKDEETGYSYFGARYYDPETSGLWLSVDPMSDKYPSINPYAYCVWNPVKLVDPDGKEIWLGKYSDNKTKKYVPNSKSNRSGSVAGMLDDIYNGSKAGKFVINKLVESKKKYFVSEREDPNGNGNPDYTNPNGERQIYLNTNKKGLDVGTLSHELFHAFQHENNQWGKARSCEVEAFLFAGIVMSQLNGGVFPKNKVSTGMGNAYTMLNPSNSNSQKYLQAMMSLTKSFSAGKMADAVSKFRYYSVAGISYGDDRGYRYCLTGSVYSGNTSLLNRFSSQIY